MAVTLVVGPGRVGRTLALAHARGGDRVLLMGLRKGDWMAWAKRAGMEALSSFPKGELLPSRVLFAVPDAALEQVSAGVAASLKAARRVRFAAHVSGYHDLKPLAPFVGAGAKVAALHPVLAFGQPEPSLAALKRGLVSVLAGRGARAEALRIVSVWGARPVFLKKGADRRRYHLGLALAANHVTASVAWAEELLAEALGGRARQAACDLARQAVEQVRREGGAEALTGPVVRDEEEVLAAHFQALPLREKRRYAGSLETVIALAEESGRLSRAAARRLRALAARYPPPAR